MWRRRILERGREEDLWMKEGETTGRRRLGATDKKKKETEERESETCERRDDKIGDERRRWEMYRLRARERCCSFLEPRMPRTSNKSPKVVI
jgi:hypothetical protein